MSAVLLIVDQYTFPSPWENEHIKSFRKKYTPTLEWIKENSIRFNNHYINTCACMPSRASILTGTMPYKHQVWQTDGLAKRKNDVNRLDPIKTPTIGNYILESGKINENNIVYIGKQHIKTNTDIYENSKRLESINKIGEIIPDNMEKYKNSDFLKEYGFKLQNGPDPHGPQETNCGFLVDNVYTDIAINWINNININDNYFMILSLIEPHDIVYFPNLWNLWNYDMNIDGVNINEILPLDNIPQSLTDDDNIDEFMESVYIKWTKDYHKYFAKQDKLKYRQFYYYLLTILDKQLGKFINYIKNKDVTLLFTSDHGDLLGTHGNGYQKWYAGFEEITHVPMNILKFENGISLYNYDIYDLTCHIDICPTILDILNININSNIIDGISLFNYMDGSNSNNYNNREIIYDIRDHITEGPNTTRFVGRFFPDLNEELDLSFKSVGDENSNFSVIVKWKIIDNEIIKIIQYYNPITMKTGVTLCYNITRDPQEKNNIYL